MQLCWIVAKKAARKLVCRMWNRDHFWCMHDCWSTCLLDFTPIKSQRLCEVEHKKRKRYEASDNTRTKSLLVEEKKLVVKQHSELGLIWKWCVISINAFKVSRKTCFNGTLMTSSLKNYTALITKSPYSKIWILMTTFHVGGAGNFLTLNLMPIRGQKIEYKEWW